MQANRYNLDIPHAYLQLPQGWNAETGSRPPEDRVWWSGKADHFPHPPDIGTRVRINFNQLGCGEVRGYFTECGFLGIYVALEKPPAWWKKQNPGRTRAMVFGAEIVRP